MLVIRVATQSQLYRTLEAKTMLERAVVVLKAGKDRVLGLFTSGNGGLLDRDLYVFCDGRYRMLTAPPTSWA